MYTEEKPSLEELMHYGKKGMKWGVTRNRSTESSSPPGGLRLAGQKTAKMAKKSPFSGVYNISSL